MSKVFRIAIILWLFLVAGYFLWEGFDYRGIFERLAEWQLRVFEHYRPGLTVALLAVLFVVPVLIVTWLVQRRARRAAPPVIAAALPLVRARQMLRVLYVVAGVMAAGAILSVAATLLLPRLDRPVVAVAAGGPLAQVPREGPATLVGATRDERVAVHQQNILWKRRVTRYVAVGTNGQGSVRYFAELRQDEPADPEGSWQPVRTGILLRNALPGTIERMYRNHGYHTTFPYYVLFASPTTYRLPYALSAIQFAIAGLITLLIALFQARHVRRLQRRPTAYGDPVAA